MSEALPYLNREKFNRRWTQMDVNFEERPIHARSLSRLIYTSLHLFHPRPSASICGSFLLCLALLSCTEEKEIPTFRIATAIEAETTPAPSENKQPRPLRWHAPETWEEETPGQFQVALYRIAPGITAAVSRFPGDAGGTAANVNRWRQQVGLEPSPDTGGEAIALAESDGQARWFELKGAERTILAAIIPVDGETWFFKLDSSTIALETARPGFMDFLKSIEIGSVAQAETPVIDLRPPSGWQKQEPAPPRFATYRIPATGPDSIDGDVSVVPLPGEGGSNLENINLWRAQLRLPALEKADDPALGETTPSPNGSITLVHMTSAEPLFSGDRHAAISAAILRTAETTWFFKLTGEAKMVAAQRAKFVDFVRTAEVR
jgi:hypothetical protein